MSGVSDGLGESSFKRALAWLVGQLAEDPSRKRGPLIDEAARRFDLSPRDADLLYAKLIDATHRRGPEPGTESR